MNKKTLKSTKRILITRKRKTITFRECILIAGSNLLITLYTFAIVINEINANLSTQKLITFLAVYVALMIAISFQQILLPLNILGLTILSCAGWITGNLTKYLLPDTTITLRILVFGCTFFAAIILLPVLLRTLRARKHH